MGKSSSLRAKRGNPGMLAKASLAPGLPRPLQGLAMTVGSVLLFLSSSFFAQKPEKTFHITGSATVFPFAAKVAERYAEKNHEKTPIVEAIGTGGGMRLFCAGTGPQAPEIVMASRPITPQERQLCLRHGINEMIEVIIGLDGIVLVQSQEAPTLHLSRRDVFEALSAINSAVPEVWSDISPFLPDMPIQILGPSPASGTRDALVELLMEPFCHSLPQYQKPACLQLRTDGAYSDVSDNQNVIIQKILLNPTLLGIISFSFYKQNHTQVKSVSIDGVFPTQKSLVQGNYIVSRYLYLYIKRDQLSPQMLRYVAEFVSADAVGPKGYLTRKGLVPLPTLLLKKMRQQIQLMEQQLRS